MAVRLKYMKFAFVCEKYCVPLFLVLVHAFFDVFHSVLLIYVGNEWLSLGYSIMVSIIVQSSTYVGVRHMGPQLSFQETVGIMPLVPALT